MQKAIGNRTAKTTARKSSCGSKEEFNEALEELLYDDDNSEGFTTYRAELRKNQRLNEIDDKADLRDGITQTKGKIMRSSGEDLSKLKLAPREQ